MTLYQAHKQLMRALCGLYGDREAANIAGLVIEHVTGQGRVGRFLNKQMPVSATGQELLQQYTQQLLLHTPVQYVLHEAWFAGMQFYVDENVLIPRPETEELVAWVGESQFPVSGFQFPVNGDANSFATGNQQPVTDTCLLDVGTGSGCIPIALKKKFAGWDVHAMDISAGALDVAKKNAFALQADISFYEADILDETQWPLFGSYNIIVSNPPYIQQSEAAAMAGNITRFEPGQALFVPDDDALLFYRSIGTFALRHLHPGGLLFFEINEGLGAEVCALLEKLGFADVVLKKDMQGNHRMARAALAQMA
jgi:release factor glutamine methyltransferase